MVAAGGEAARRFSVRTYGCQMNVHDSEKIANLFHHAGLEAAGAEADADVLVINTCSIRDKAEQQLYSDLGVLRQWKAARPGRVLGVGGCTAQQVGASLLRRFGHVDFVFGTHNLREVPVLAAQAQEGKRSASTEVDRSHERFDLPERHPDLGLRGPGRAFVTVMEGCDMFCSFCIVPFTRGREISRRSDDIVAEVERLADAGIVEVTLLGQTVNAYGRHDVRQGRTATAGTMPFAELLSRIDAIEGIERIRYTSPHPSFFDDDLTRAHAQLASLCPHVHLPLQSGSDRVLSAMRRRYSRDEYLEITRALRGARPDIALTTDLIVGFPGESEADFEQTLDLVAEVGFVDHFSFKYSPRPGTAAEGLGEAASPEEAQGRLERLQALQGDLTRRYHAGRVGEHVEVLVEGESRKGGGQLCGRDPQHRVVNLEAPHPPRVRPGRLVPVEITQATPHSLIGRFAPDFPRESLKGPRRSADERARKEDAGAPASRAP